ncbi:unnamed protein product [Toxocara canis]|uniref:CUB domain-containing protein n=1 Tax=Toxocara canis TaxID=6265 RepID=A0A183VFV8_TOXCA|nr:unnamed protein product [Toxocara canis]
MVDVNVLTRLYYCPKLDCSWKLVAPDNYTVIKFYSNNLDLRHGKDFIYFYNHDNARPDIEPAAFSHSDYSCTGTDECDFTSSGQYLTIRFLSAEGEPDRFGFQGTAALYSPYRQRMATLFKYKVAGGIGIAAFFILVVGGSIVLYLMHRMKGHKKNDTEVAAKNKLLEQ